MRALLGYMFGHPGKKLLFMGGEFGQWQEWGHDRSLDWHLLEQPAHLGLLRWYEDLNHYYRSQPALYSGYGNGGGVESSPMPAHGHYHSLLLALPPLAVLYLQPGGTRAADEPV